MRIASWFGAPRRTPTRGFTGRLVPLLSAVVSCLLVVPPKPVEGIEPVTITLIVGGGLGIGAAKYAWCKLRECCNEDWIGVNRTELSDAWAKEVFGQHLAERMVMNTFFSHVQNPELSKKALVLSFHGWTGTGKNLVSSLLAKSLYRKGTESSFFHLFIGGKDFPNDNDPKAVLTYKQKLKEKIVSAVSACPYSMFVFDEVDKMQPGVLDALSAFTDHHNLVDGVDYRKAIFIFLNNAGGEEIAKVTFDFWGSGRKREDIDVPDIESLVRKDVYSASGGLQGSYIIEKNLIDAFVPFLPLEKEHVKKCIEVEVKKQRGWCKPSAQERLLNSLTYYPEEMQLFSTKGCKTVNKKLSMYCYT